MFAGQAWNIREPVVATREKGHPHVTMGARLGACAFHPPYVSSGERIGVCFGPTSQTHGLSNYLRPAMHGTVPLTLIFYALSVVIHHWCVEITLTACVALFRSEIASFTILSMVYCATFDDEDHSPSTALCSRV